jgi:GT2 family glycosyltransferase
LISVVVPTCDRPDALRVVMDRLAPGAQRLDAARYEVIVTDDGGRVRAADTLGASHPWARVVQGPRRGPAANRNAGATFARGAWIGFTDDDTEPSLDWLAAFADAIAPGTDVYEGRTTCDGGFGSPLYHAPVNETGGRLWSCNFLVAASAFRAVRGFDEGFAFPNAEDQDLRDRLLAAGFTMLFVRDAVVNHPPRRQPNGARLGEHREADVRYMYKRGVARPVWPLLLRKIARHKLNVIRDTPKSLDTLIALGSLARELWYTARHVGAWEAKYAAEFPGRPTASP